MIGPDKTMPSPTPTPRMDERKPMPPTTRSRGNSSRMMPKASGKTAPPAPVNDPAASMIGKVVARALIRVPRVSTTRIGHQDPLLAQHVAHPAQDGRADGGAQEVPGEQPGHGVGRRMQRVFEGREGRDDERTAGC